MRPGGRRHAGRTPLAENPVHVRFRDSAGGEHAALCPFRGDGGAAQVFPVEVPEGACAVSLVFLPGSRFDLESFRFEPFEPV